MANGFYGSKETWRRIIAPLADADELMAQFAEARGMELTRNDHGWPERSLLWGTDVRRRFQIYTADEKKETFSVWVVAWKDRVDRRAWRRETLREGVPWAALREELPALLEEGVRLADGWGEADLVLVVKGRPGDAMKAFKHIRIYPSDAGSV